MKEINVKEKQDIENKIIDWITRGAGDRLIVFKPKEKIEGVDLIVKKRGKYEDKEISLQINGQLILDKDRLFVKDILKEGFKVSQNFYLIFVYFDKIEQDIYNYFWILPSLEFSDRSETVLLKDKTAVLRFQSPLDIKQKNKYSKFLIDKKIFGDIMLKIVASAGRFEFPENGFIEVKTINLENLKKFIAEARRNTYAKDATPIANPRLMGSVQLEYQKANYFYQDIYFDGKINFIGQEVVYQNSLPVWAMNYFGSNLSKEATDFLKQSLSALSDKCRFGQICRFEKRAFKYQDEGQGSLEKFSGKEEIFQKGKSIYILTYQGGLI